MLSLTQSLEPLLAPTGVKIQTVLPGLTRTEIFERCGRSLDDFASKMIMETNDLVDAALAGCKDPEVCMFGSRFPALPYPHPLPGKRINSALGAGRLTNSALGTGGIAGS